MKLQRYIRNQLIGFSLILSGQANAQTVNRIQPVADSSAWVGVWEVSTGKLIRSESIQVASSSDRLDLDRNETTGQIICRASDGIIELAAKDPIRMLDSGDSDDFHWPRLTKFIPGLGAILSIRFNAGSPIGYAQIISLDARSTSKLVTLGPIGYQLAVLSNGNIVRANGGRITILERVADKEWRESGDIEFSTGKISAISDLSDISYIAVWTKSSFQVIDVNSKSTCFQLAKQIDSWPARPVVSPDRASIAINEGTSIGESWLSIYQLNLKKKEPIIKIPLKHGWLTGLAFSPSGGYLAAGPGEWPEIFIYSTNTGKLVKTLRIPKRIDHANSQHPVIVYSADGKYLYAVFINPQC